MIKLLNYKSRTWPRRAAYAFQLASAAVLFVFSVVVFFVADHASGALLASGSVVIKPNASYPQGAVMDIMQALQEGMIQISDLTQNEFRDIKGKLKRVRDHVLYHTFRLKTATAWPRGTYPLFQDAIGKQVAAPNDAASTYTQDYSDTNMKVGGQFSKGTSMVVQSIQAPFDIPVSLDTTALLTGNAIDPTPLAQGANGNGAAALAAALRENVSMRFQVDGVNFEEGPLRYFPSDFSLTGATNGTNDGFISNGLKGRWLSRVRHLESQQPFTVELTVENDITIIRSCRVGCALVGVLYQPVVG